MSIGKYVHPTTYPSLADDEISVINKIHDFTEKYFQDARFDASHDFDHVKRVVNNALVILEKEEERRKLRAMPALNPLFVILGALLHDVEDKKYVTADYKESPLAKAVLDTGMSTEYAEQLRLLVEGVSYSSEIKDPQHVTDLIEVIPELAVVQDADRLDAIGAIGIGRCFTFGGAKGARSLADSIQHFEDKLLRLESMIKTEAGKTMAEERSNRIREFMGWWQDEIGQ
ncbi:hypothetical protein EDD36DRAFT_59281 [Exophiala viscosa]|uniref:HD/PDEase domain-containing protein n=1 Tax=Exophiala viscosa TaxID=2486360 RepID=A0AAN6DQR0_9EURO|nr:hypothetical protein EDD36DRAFT_59281 [Exophiala viscosa]